MVEFVHYDVVIIIRRKAIIQGLGIYRLHRNEQIVQAGRLIAANKQFTEVWILQNALECIPALLQYFFPVGNKQKPVPSSWVCLAESAIIKGRNHRFTGTCCGNHQIAIPAANLALGIELVQNL